MRDFARLQMIGWVSRQTSVVGVAILFAVVLAWLGALNSASYDLFQRMGYWTINLVGWSLISSLVLAMLSRWPWAAAPRSWRRIVAATLLASPPMLAITAATTMRISDWRPLPHELLQQLLSIWLIGGAYLYVCEQLRARPQVEPMEPLWPEAAQAPDVQEASALADARIPIGRVLAERMPPHLGTDILCLRVEDHYVRVYTRRGDTLILARFGDAIGAVSAIEGLRVHRSWWVAAGAVDRLRRSGRTAELDLCNGLSVPVSQPYLVETLSHWRTVLAP